MRNLDFKNPVYEKELARVSSCPMIPPPPDRVPLTSWLLSNKYAMKEQTQKSILVIKKEQELYKNSSSAM